MERRYDMAVFIGRFQPFHLGHKHVIEQALKCANNVAVLIGSARSSRGYRNPFTFAERKEMILGSFNEDVRRRILVLPLEDAAYNDAQWIRNVQFQVEQACYYAGLVKGIPTPILSDLRITLIGHSKDASSYYLKLFPQWSSIEVPSLTRTDGKLISSTWIRELYFNDPIGFFEANIGLAENDIPLPPNTDEWLDDFKSKDEQRLAWTPEYKAIRDEYLFIKEYRRQWEAAPYPPTFVTVDAVVVQSGHVLLVRRKAAPGKGLWAMPGGFINQNERIRDAVIRELREETKIKVPNPVLEGSIVEQDVFDDPNRSGRGRTITHAFLIKLKDDTTLPKVKGSDDADKARWVPISQLKPEDFFEDHYAIIQCLLGRI